MTTAQATFNWGNGQFDNSAYIRTSGQGVHNLLAAVGLTQTSDTGQADWATAVAGGNSGPAMWTTYEMWKWTDAYGDVYLKIGYTVGSPNGYMEGVVLAFGTATDGAGNFVGPHTLATAPITAHPSTNVGSWISYACLTSDGILSLQLAGVYYTLERRRNPTTGAVMMEDSFTNIARSSSVGVWGQTAGLAVSYSYNVKLRAWYLSTNNCLIPWGLTASGPNKMIHRWQTYWPQPQILLAGCCYMPSEFTTDTTFQVTPVGSTPRTYRATGQLGMGNGGQAYPVALIWE